MKSRNQDEDCCVLASRRKGKNGIFKVMDIAYLADFRVLCVGTQAGSKKSLESGLVSTDMSDKVS